MVWGDPQRDFLRGISKRHCGHFMTVKATPGEFLQFQVAIAKGSNKKQENAADAEPSAPASWWGAPRLQPARLHAGAMGDAGLIWATCPSSRQPPSAVS